VTTTCPHGQSRSPDPSSTCVVCRAAWFSWKYSTVYGHSHGMDWCREQGQASAERWFAERAQSD
jgi:hypothetical protein